MAPHATSETASAVATTLRPLLLGLRRDLQALLPAADAPAAPPRCGLELGRRHAVGLHELLDRLFRAVHDPSSRAWSGVALAGVGAVGRGAVALGSDLDLRLLASAPTAAAPAAEALLYPLWDLGVAVGHQVVSVDALLQSARDDLPSATALLDWRHIGGDEALHDALLRKAGAGLFSHSELPRFMQRLGDEVSHRHARFGGSVYLLEPDVKNGQGGLRDLDVARWAARARFGVAELDELVRTGALLPREALDLAAAGELLWRIRNLLHAHAGRRSDRLTFDEQEIIAPLLGYQGDPADGAEQLMSDYYRSARTIGRGLEVILSRSTPVLTRRRPPHEEDLGDGVRSFDGSVTVADADRLREDPALAMRVMRAAVERAAPLLPWARDAIGRVAHDPAWCAALRSSAEARRIFVDLCASRREVPLKSGTVMRELHDLGLLLAMIPEFSPVVGRVHHDVYHVYTVDVHSVAAVDRLAALVRGDLADEHPLACRLAAEVPRPQTLFFATLLHDVGKAIGGKDHSQRGAQMARGILTRLGFEPEDVDEAAHLILEHLSMYHVATRRDLDDPATVAEFARRMGERETLRDLYLLTVADLSTTSPTSMTSWKASMLDELYLRTDAALIGEIPDGAGGPGRAARVTELVLAHAREQTRADVPVPADAQQQRELEAWLPRYLASMPERYLLSNTPAAIVAHAALARDQERRAPAAGDAGAPIVALVPTRHPGTAEICAVATDRPGLLSAITAAIAASRLEVHAAQIHSRAMDAGAVQAVDLFWVRDRGEGEPGVARALPKLAADLQSVLSGNVDARELARRRGGSALRERPTPRVSTRVSIDDRASNRHTVIDVSTRDRPGLLFAIADAVYRAGLSIAVAKINTEGTRVADVFYVSEADGSKVARGARAKAVQDAVEAALASLDS